MRVSLYNIYSFWIFPILYSYEIVDVFNKKKQSKSKNNFTNKINLNPITCRVSKTKMNPQLYTVIIHIHIKNPWIFIWNTLYMPSSERFFSFSREERAYVSKKEEEEFFLESSIGEIGRVVRVHVP